MMNFAIIWYLLTLISCSLIHYRIHINSSRIPCLQLSTLVYFMYYQSPQNSLGKWESDMQEKKENSYLYIWHHHQTHTHTHILPLEIGSGPLSIYFQSVTVWEKKKKDWVNWNRPERINYQHRHFLHWFWKE